MWKGVVDRRIVGRSCCRVEGTTVERVGRMLRGLVETVCLAVAEEACLAEQHPSDNPAVVSGAGVRLVAR